MKRLLLASLVIISGCAAFDRPNEYQVTAYDVHANYHPTAEGLRGMGVPEPMVQSVVSLHTPEMNEAIEQARK